MGIIGYIPRRIDDNHADLRIADSGAYIVKDSMSISPESSGVLNEAAVYNYVASELTPYEQFTYLTSGEVAQLQNINEIAISNAQWNYLGTMNQNVATTGAPSFGKLLVGTTIEPSPASRFVVKGTTSDGSTDIIVGQNSGGNEIIAINTYGITEIRSTPTLTGDVKRTLLLMDNSSAYSSSPKNAIEFWGKYNSGGDLAGFSAIGGGKENSTDGNYAGFIGFYTRSQGAAEAERVRISSAGNILVGTTTENGTAKLQVKGGISCNTLQASGLPTSDPGVAGQIWASGQNLVISVG